MSNDVSTLSTFRDLALIEPLLKALDDVGYLPANCGVEGRVEGFIEDGKKLGDVGRPLRRYQISVDHFAPRAVEFQFRLEGDRGEFARFHLRVAHHQIAGGRRV